MGLVSPATCPAGTYAIAPIPNLLPKYWKEIAENSFGSSNVVYENASEYEENLNEGNFQTSAGVDFAIMMVEAGTYFATTGEHVHAFNSHIGCVLLSGVEQKTIGTKTWLGGGATIYIDSATPTIIRNTSGHGIGLTFTSTAAWAGPVRKIASVTNIWSQSVSTAQIVFDSVSIMVG